MKFTTSVAMTVFVLFSFTLASYSQQTPTSRGAIVEGISNEHSSFAVRVDVDRADRVYAKDDLLNVTVESSEDGYLYLFYRDSQGNVAVLFPNKFQTDNAIKKSQLVTVPMVGSNFRIRIDSPFGDELLKAVVSKKPLENVDIERFSKGNVTPVDEGAMKQFAKSLPTGKDSTQSDWAEHKVDIQTVQTRPGASDTGSGKRYAVAVGISDFKDPDINNLGICHIDAESIMALFTSRFGVEKNDAILLTNEKATLENIRKVIKETLPKMTNPGDVVFIFWSGHGGQMPDKTREFLIPYDGAKADVEGTMLFDETFGRWIQELDGRKVLIVLDACHSGGQAESAKSQSFSLSKALDSDANDWQPMRFALSRLAVAKDIGQKDTAVIASSTSAEVSYVRKEKDLSVLTYYLLHAIEDSQKSVTHDQWCEMVKPKVADYVEQNFSNNKQTVVMQDGMSEPLILNR